MFSSFTRRFGPLVLFAGVLALAGCDRDAAPAGPDPLADWNPSLDQPIRQLQETVDAAYEHLEKPLRLREAGAEVTFEDESGTPPPLLAYAVANLGLALDAQLYLVFDRHLKSLPESQRAAARQKQRDWLRLRDERVRAESARYAGGTAEGYVAAEVFVKETRQRLAELVPAKKMATKRPVTIVSEAAITHLP